MEKKTPLYDIHVAGGGKMVSFAGYLLPVQYKTGVIKEHMAVRQNAGLFDVSHMGEILFTGPTVLESINHILTNDFTGMPEGRVRYTLMCNENGGIIDDLVICKFRDDAYLAIVNASNREKDFSHMTANLLDGTEVKDLSDSTAMLALQGPNSQKIIAKLLPEEQIPGKYYTALPHVRIAGMESMISRTGYTGEAGFEIYTAAENGSELWKVFMEAGDDYGLIPCGLGARDTLRLEAAMPLYGNEMDETVTPFEAGLDFAVKMGKTDFIGKQALEKAVDPDCLRVGLCAVGRGIIREHQNIYIGDEIIGMTTSGTFAPYLNRAVAMAMVKKEYAKIGTEVEADVRGRRVAARVAQLPFYKHC